MSREKAGRDGRPGRLAVVRTARGVWVGWPGGARFFGPERVEAEAQSGATAEVRAPMTGRVVKVPVAPGQPVEVDDVLVILQAMKMEYRLTAPIAGVIAAVLCVEGEMVELGATLVAFAAAPEEAPAGKSAGETKAPAAEVAPAPRADPTARRTRRGRRSRR